MQEITLSTFLESLPKNSKKENIYFISQEDYHLDLSIRPIGNPYVLINNPQMVLENKCKIKGLKSPSRDDLEEIKPKMLQYKKAIEQLKLRKIYFV